ncbi:MAG: hypothetical protein GXO26_08220 [Crenarchaeota archaeon]|nr:hypothetical protein [Thermoproteota archaeon]
MRIVSSERRALLRTRNREKITIFRNINRMFIPVLKDSFKIVLKIDKKYIDIIDRLDNYCMKINEDSKYITYECSIDIEDVPTSTLVAVEYRGQMAMTGRDLENLIASLIMLHLDNVERSEPRFRNVEFLREENIIRSELASTLIFEISIIENYLKHALKSPAENFNYLKKVSTELHNEFMSLWEKYGNILKSEYSIEEPPSRSFLEKKLNVF